MTTCHPVDSNLPVYDHLQLGLNHNLLALLDQQCLENGEDSVETVKFAAMAYKINPMKRRQSRVLLITDKALYNFKKDSYSSFRRRIPIDHIRGMVIARHSNEIVFQIQDGYDYHYIVDNRLGVVEVTGTYVERLTKRKFEVCISEDSSLTSYVLTKSEWKNAAPELIKRRSSTHPEKVYHPKLSAANWIKLNLKNWFQQKASEVNSVVKGGWVTYESDAIWQQYFMFLKPRSLLLLKAKQRGSFSTSDIELSNDIESDLSSSDVDDHTFNLKGSEEPPRFFFSVFSNKQNRTTRLGSNSKEEFLNWRRTLQESSTTPSDICTDGWLFKQDHGVKSWRRYYFVLKAQTCFYFDMEIEMEIGLKSFHAEAVLGETAATATVNGNGIGALSLNGFPYRFKIKDGRKQYHLASDSEQSRDEWIWTINATIEEGNGCIEVSIVPKSLPDQSFESSQEPQVTLVVTDVQGSTMLWEREPQAMNTALEMHDEILRSALSRCKGYEVKTEGDAFIVAFIEALDAIRWCVSVQNELLKAPWPPSLLNCYDMPLNRDESGDASQGVTPGATTQLFAGLRVRMGVHTGTPRKRRDSVTNRIDYAGSDVHLTSRISSAAHGGQIICSDVVVKAIKMKVGKDDDFSVVRLPGSYKLQQVRKPKSVVLYEIWPKGLEGRKLLLPEIRAIRTSRLLAS